MYHLPCVNVAVGVVLEFKASRISDKVKHACECGCSALAECILALGFLYELSKENAREVSSIIFQVLQSRITHIRVIALSSYHLS